MPSLRRDPARVDAAIGRSQSAVRVVRSEIVPHPSACLDDVVHQRARLGIMAVLSEVAETDFTTIRATLGLTAGNLSRHLTILQEAALIRSRKTFDGKKARTWVALTDAGRLAYGNEVEQLRALVRRYDEIAPR